MAFSTKNADLHLGILNMQLNRLKEQLRGTAQKLQMKDQDGKPMFDEETEKLNYSKFLKEATEKEAEIVSFESKVLKLTEL